MVEVVEIVFSTNYNCPSGKDDAAIALSVRTLYIATESDTSLPSVRSTGKSAAPRFNNLQQRLVNIRGRLIKHARYYSQ
jgi:hypothetical protein